MISADKTFSKSKNYQLSEISLEEMCPSNLTVDRKITGPWEPYYEKYNPELWDYCMTATCNMDHKKVKAMKCLSNVNRGRSVRIEYRFYEIGDDEEIVRLWKHDYASIYLDDSNECYESCRPKEEKNFGLLSPNRSGLDRKSCFECVVSKKNPREESRFIAKYNLSLKKSDTCYHACMPDTLDFNVDPQLDERCPDCLGLNNDKYLFVLNKENTCYKFYLDKSKAYEKGWKCPQSSTTYTEYIKEKSKSAFKLFLNPESYDCFEIDSYSKGIRYKMQVHNSFCEGIQVNNSDRVLNKKVEAPKVDVNSKDKIQDRPVNRK